MKLPAIQFYTGDWRKDPGIQALDFEARGLWFEMLCLMNESADRGRLTLNGAAMPIPALARILGVSEDLLNQILTKLLTYGVASRCPDSGVIFNRRMVRDEEIRKKRADAGKLGGNPVLLKQNSTNGSTIRPSKVEPLHVNETEHEDEVEAFVGERGAGERGEVGCALETALAYALSSPVPISGPCVTAWHEDRSRAHWHYPKSKKLFPLPPGDAAWQNDLRIFARNWKSVEDERSATKGNGSTPSTPAQPKAESVWQLKQAEEAVNESIRLIDATVIGAWGELTPERKIERRKLVERRKEIRRKLAGLEA
jgi:hypothetical protein